MVRAIMVGGEFDGQIREIADFRVNAVPNGYESMDTIGWVLNEPYDGMHPRTKYRMEIVIAEDIPADERDSRTILALAKACGLVLRRGFHAPDALDAFGHRINDRTYGEVTRQIDG